MYLKKDHRLLAAHPLQSASSLKGTWRIGAFLLRANVKGLLVLSEETGPSEGIPSGLTSTVAQGCYLTSCSSGVLGHRAFSLSLNS